MKTLPFFKYLLLAVLLFTLWLNFYVGRYGLAGLTPAAVSALHPSYITPAGYAFAIWGLIYLGLLAFGVYQLFAPQGLEETLQKIRPWFLLNLLLNCAWLVAFQYEYIGTSTVIIIGMTATLVHCYIKLGIGVNPSGKRELWLVRVPVSLYLSWVTVATIVAISIFLSTYHLTGATNTPMYWAPVVLAVIFFFCLFFLLKLRDFTFGLVALWAVVAIAIAQAGVPLVRYSAYIVAVLISASILLTVFTKKQDPNAPTSEVVPEELRQYI